MSSVTAKRIVKFGITGVLATGVAYVSFPFIYIYVLAGKHHLAAYIFASIINITVSFTLQRIYVFRSANAWFPEYTQFWASAALIIFISYVCMNALIFRFHINPVVANSIIVTFSAITGYLVHSKLTFKSDHESRSK
jgi:putative flippase GtrA